MRTQTMAGDLAFAITGRNIRIPNKFPVILCHGLGLNATFWTITDDHLPSQLTSRGYDVYVFDIRGSGENAHLGRCDRINKLIRETPLRERGERQWNVDDLVHYDVPAILDYIKRETGQDRVNWVGHSLGGMLIVPYLELDPQSDRIANFVGMGSTIIQAETPQWDMLRANRAPARALALRQPRTDGTPAQVLPASRYEHDRSILFFERERRSADGLAFLRLHA